MICSALGEDTMTRKRLVKIGIKDFTISDFK